MKRAAKPNGKIVLERYDKGRAERGRIRRVVQFRRRLNKI